MDKLKWWQYLISGCIIGVLGTLAVYFYFRKPDVDYLLKNQKQGIEIEQQKQLIANDKKEIIDLKEKWRQDTISRNKQLDDFKNDKVGKEFAPAHARVRAQSVDDDITMSRQSFPQENPYRQ